MEQTSVVLWGSSLETIRVIGWIVTAKQEVAFVLQRVAAGLCWYSETTGEGSRWIECVLGSSPADSADWLTDLQYSC